MCYHSFLGTFWYIFTLFRYIYVYITCNQFGWFYQAWHLWTFLNGILWTLSALYPSTINIINLYSTLWLMSGGSPPLSHICWESLCFCIYCIYCHWILWLETVERSICVYHVKIRFLRLMELVTLLFHSQILYSICIYLTTLLDVRMFHTILYFLTQWITVLTYIEPICGHQQISLLLCFLHPIYCSFT